MNALTLNLKMQLNLYDTNKPTAIFCRTLQLYLPRVELACVTSHRMFTFHGDTLVLKDAVHVPLAGTVRMYESNKKNTTAVFIQMGYSHIVDFTSDLVFFTI
jgi:hypothetical protein